VGKFDANGFSRIGEKKHSVAVAQCGLTPSSVWLKPFFSLYLSPLAEASGKLSNVNTRKQQLLTAHKRQRNRAASLLLSEVMTIIVAFHSSG